MAGQLWALFVALGVTPASPGTYILLLTRPGISHVAAQKITVVQ